MSKTCGVAAEVWRKEKALELGPKEKMDFWRRGFSSCVKNVDRKKKKKKREKLKRNCRDLFSSYY